MPGWTTRLAQVVLLPLVSSWLYSSGTNIRSAVRDFKGSRQVLTMENDTYGILDCDWATVRNVNWTSTIFAD